MHTFDVAAFIGALIMPNTTVEFIRAEKHPTAETEVYRAVYAVALSPNEKEERQVEVLWTHDEEVIRFGVELSLPKVDTWDADLMGQLLLAADRINAVPWVVGRASLLVDDNRDMARLSVTFPMKISLNRSEEDWPVLYRFVGDNVYRLLDETAMMTLELEKVLLQAHATEEAERHAPH